ncbi:MAG: hypothetical protein U0234_07535 [Sandaracinus sp.]
MGSRVALGLCLVIVGCSSASPAPPAAQPEVPRGLPAAAFGFELGATLDDGERYCRRLEHTWSVTSSSGGGPIGHCTGSATADAPAGIVSLRYCGGRACLISLGFVASDADAELVFSQFASEVERGFGPPLERSRGSLDCLSSVREQSSWSGVSRGDCQIAREWELAQGRIGLMATASSDARVLITLSYWDISRSPRPD